MVAGLGTDDLPALIVGTPVAADAAKATTPELATEPHMPVPADFATNGGFGEEVTLTADGTPSDIRWTDPRVGRTLGLYRVLKPLADGGMGQVYLATHSTYGDLYALKVLDHAKAGANALERFQREARALVELEHPNIVRVVDFGTTNDGTSFLVMELAEGEPLADALSRLGALHHGLARQFALQIGSAVAAAHAAGFIHRALKPENVIVLHTPDGPLLKLLDFGLAGTTGGDMGITDRHSIVGTPGYMAPEVIGKKGAEPASDVYSLGAILYEMIAGEAPFAGDVTELLVGHLHSEPPPAPEGNPLSDLTMRMLTKAPEGRPTLESVLLELEIEPEPPVEDVEPDAVTDGRMRRGGVMFGGAAALGLAAAATYLVFV